MPLTPSTRAMVSLRSFTLILLTLCCREVAGADPSLPAGRALLAVLAMVLGFAVLTKMLAFRMVRLARADDWRSLTHAREAFDGWRRTLEWLWILALPATLVLSGWCGWSLVLQQAGGPQWVGLLWCFLPSLLWLLLVELSAAQLDEVCQPGSASHWLAGWWLRLRLGDMAGWLTCLVPIFLLAAAADLAGWLADWLEIDSTGVSLAVGAGLLLTIPLVLPAAMTRWSSGRPLPERLQPRVTAICERVGVKGVVAVLIPSGNRWRGAAIVGWLPRFRRLWLGDGLISSLDSRQLDMVLLHELAHVKRRHFLWRVLPLGWSLAAGGLVWCLGDQLGWAESAGLQFAAALTSGLVLLVGLGAMARRCELDADWIACDLAVCGTDWSCDVSPAQVLSSALGRLCDRRPSRAATWLHPSLARRLDHLARWQSAASGSAQPAGA